MFYLFLASANLNLILAYVVFHFYRKSKILIEDNSVLLSELGEQDIELDRIESENSEFVFVSQCEKQDIEDVIREIEEDV